ncbi:glutamyl-tRNA(Gln) amidotransferase subunit B, mitochondrial isoform X2 [Condylostylus longicornis]|uniref:glutamyl-tRNA(Gln) amidotransferase subunit B, mitochondrial isoform X2 n=1 Tax=Condylostylus longicornis TaxID=2530218 RepID=UPI00244E1BAB|nr:glutamyl-tRNA(Gln) amidotransferase subunit B, mitochondrial isoform X2 [Condylostylus longicornis]
MQNFSLIHFVFINCFRKDDWISVVGLEVHAQISSNTKLFSGSENKFAASVNQNVSLFDSAIPGTLPVLNKYCVESALRTAIALNCKINNISMFDRKHYFYADLPAGYQITQQRKAIANHGKITFPVYVPGVVKKPYEKTVRLFQLQLEQDSGKSLHDTEAKRSLVDLNRAGIPLMELVFEPDLSDGEEAASLVKELIITLKRLGSCNCRMEEGALRVDANISIHRAGEPLGVRTEIKNIGSVRNVAQAIAYEIERQKCVKTNGGEIINETRSWNALTRKTITMRDKEVQQDYRFMPEPNLPPLHIDMEEDDIDRGILKYNKLKTTIPELPSKTREILVNEIGLSKEIAIILVNEPFLLNYFNDIIKMQKSVPPKIIANFLINELMAACNKININIEICKIKVGQLSNILALLHNGFINLTTVKIILDDLNEDPNQDVMNIIKNKDLQQISDAKEIEKICVDAIGANKKAVEQFKNGKAKAIFAIAGHISKVTNQKANMNLVMKKLEELLKQNK